MGQERFAEEIDRQLRRAQNLSEMMLNAALPAPHGRSHGRTPRSRSATIRSVTRE